MSPLGLESNLHGAITTFYSSTTDYIRKYQYSFHDSKTQHSTLYIHQFSMSKIMRDSGFLVALDSFFSTLHRQDTVIYHQDPVLGQWSQTFPSLEHAYQASRCPHDKRWEKGGVFSDWEWVMDRVNEARPDYDVNEYKHHKAIGILAILVAQRPLTFCLRQGPHDFSEKRWFPLLDAKFKGELLTDLLRTSRPIFEKALPQRYRDDSGRGAEHNSGFLVGTNKVGKLMAKFRESKRHKRKRDTDQEVQLSMDPQQALQKKFKDAEANGSMIVIQDDAEDPQEPPSHDADKFPLIGIVENIAVTFAGCIESDHTGVSHGTKRRGFTKEDLVNIARLYPGKAVIYTVPGGPEAHVLVIRRWAIGANAHIYDEICHTEAPFIDCHQWMYGKCRPKKARVNTNYTFNVQQKGQMDHPDPKQRIPSLQIMGPQLRVISARLDGIASTTGVDTKDLLAEVNFYRSDTDTIQGIGEHMDNERNVVVGLCIGSTLRNLCLQAYKGATPIGPKLKLDLYPGDIYFMDKNAKGTGSTRAPHVKHHASGGLQSETYLKRVTQARRRKLLKKKDLNKYAQAIVNNNEFFTNGNPVYY